jgi:NTP pyrophosphatase (non-canonical NTP hydrolase)
MPALFKDSMPTLNLKENPTLKDIQEYVADMEKERGFTEESVIQKCLLLGEEMGELFNAVRKVEKIKTDEKSNVNLVFEELADILIYISAIANKYGIDLEKAFRDKEEINKKRQWK